MADSIFSFDFVSTHWEEGYVSFHYTLYHQGVSTHFVEKLTFPPEFVLPDDDAALEAALHACHMALGISYYKLTCAPIIHVKSRTLSQHEAQFWQTVYTKGLGEFFYVNDLEPVGRIHFPYAHVSNKKTKVTRFEHTGALVGIGGGKDSLVSVELLKKAGVDVFGYVLASGKEYPVITDSIKTAGIPSLTIHREIDSQLFTMHGYNGHIPISALYTFVGVLTCILYKKRFLIASNERSANYGNVRYRGVEINHQWSKSEEFEKLSIDYIGTYISPDIVYTSLLRPFFEFAIVKMFSELTVYFPVFSSCNRNFTITKDGLSQGSRWCCQCPKCVFAFTLLSAFLPKTMLISIFGDNLYEKPDLSDLFLELLGEKGIKPFECVGTPDEMKAAMYLVYKKGEYAGTHGMKLYENMYRPNDVSMDALVERLLNYYPSKYLPQELSKRVFTL